VLLGATVADAEAGHHLVEDEKGAVLVAQGAETLQGGGEEGDRDRVRERIREGGVIMVVAAAAASYHVD
jgi:hypothetical protein